MPRFNSNDPKYRCCCRCCHVRTGALLVGGLEIIAVCLASIAAVILFVYDGYREARWRQYGPDRRQFQTGEEPGFVATEAAVVWLVCALAAAVLGLLCVALLFVGVVKERPGLLVPHMLGQAMAILGLLALVAFLCIRAVHVGERLADDASLRHDEKRRMDAVVRLSLLVSGMAAALIMIAVFIFFFVVVLRCYRYLRDAEAYDQLVRYPADPHALQRLRD